MLVINLPCVNKKGGDQDHMRPWLQGPCIGGMPHRKVSLTQWCIYFKNNKLMIDNNDKNYRLRDFKISEISCKALFRK